MSRQRVVSYTVTNTLAGVVKIKDTLILMGYTMHDDQSGSNDYYVLKNPGSEIGDQIPFYMQIKWGTASSSNYITFTIWLWWNNSTQVGATRGYESVSIGLGSSDSSSFFLWVYGDLDRVVLCSKVGSIYDTWFMGYMKPYGVVKTSLMASAISGATTIYVSDASQFKVNKYYQIVNYADATNQRRDRVLVTGVTIDSAGDSLDIAAGLPGAYNNNSQIGQNPMAVFAGSSYSTSLFLLNPLVAVGTNNYNVSVTGIVMGSSTAADPDERFDQEFTGMPQLFYESTSHFGVVDSLWLLFPTTGMSIEDTLTLNTIDTGTATSATATTLTDTSKSWIVDVYANKVIVVTGGTGVGQTRKISSNTSDTLTLDEAWVIQVDATSTYSICDESWRYFQNFIVREI